MKIPHTGLYVTHTQFILLGDRPLHSSAELREAWRPIFDNENCFYDLRNLIKYPYGPFASDPLWKPFSLASKPFIRNLGDIYFESRSSRLNSSQNGRFYLVMELRRDRFEDDSDSAPGTNQSDEYGEGYSYKEDLFGFDPNVADDRMNFLYYQLQKPIRIKAITEKSVSAQGKLFIHIYPSGYVAITVALTLSWNPRLSSMSMNSLLYETRPWREDSKWQWESRIGSGKLFEVIDLVKLSLQRSFFNHESVPLHQDNWHSALRMSSEENADSIARTFSIKGDYEVLDLTNHAAASWYKEWGDATSLRYMIVSRQGVICIARPDSERKKALRFFWKILTLWEFVLFKKRIYRDYVEFLETEVPQLKVYRLSLKRKATKEDVFRLSVYDPSIHEFLSLLDSHIGRAAPFHRRIYSMMSSASGFDEQRQRVIALVKQWEDEVSKWEHGLLVVWKKFLAPLKALLK